MGFKFQFDSIRYTGLLFGPLCSMTYCTNHVICVNRGACRLVLWPETEERRDRTRWQD